MVAGRSRRGPRPSAPSRRPWPPSRRPWAPSRRPWAPSRQSGDSRAGGAGAGDAGAGDAGTGGSGGGESGTGASSAGPGQVVFARFQVRTALGRVRVPRRQRPITPRRPLAARLGAAVLDGLLLAGATLVGTAASGAASSGPASARPVAATRAVGREGHAVAHRLAAPGSGLVAGRIDAIGDSILIDYEQPLDKDLPGVVVDAAVSRQFAAGVTVVEQLRAKHELGTKVVIDLGTNGTVTPAELDQMLHALRGVARVVFVTVHVDQPWQNEVNAVLRAGVAAHKHQTRLADWAKLAAKHPGWFYGDGTHLPIGGPGAAALAALVAAAVKQR
jgi:hypothetical protein